jgi:hypothetical protein
VVGTLPATARLPYAHRTPASSLPVLILISSSSNVGWRSRQAGLLLLSVICKATEDAEIPLGERFLDAIVRLFVPPWPSKPIETASDTIFMGW